MAASSSKRKADLKVVLIGASGVGKTCLVTRYIQDTFDSGIQPTIGASFFLKQHGPYNVAIWDTAGQERFSGLSSFYCRDAGAAVMAYNISSIDSFDMLRNRFLPLLADQDCLKVVVGTKQDLIGDGNGELAREVTPQLARSFAQEINEDFLSRHSDIPLPVFETSSKENIGIDAMFKYIFDNCLGSLSSEYTLNNARSTIRLHGSNAKIPRSSSQISPKKKCCSTN